MSVGSVGRALDVEGHRFISRIGRARVNLSLDSETMSVYHPRVAAVTHNIVTRNVVTRIKDLGHSAGSLDGLYNTFINSHTPLVA